MINILTIIFLAQQIDTLNNTSTLTNDNVDITVSQLDGLSPREKLMRLNSALLNKMWSKCSGDTDYASKIFRFLFQKDDLIGKNLFGRVFKLHLQPKDAVDGAVVETIRQLVLEKYPDCDWKKCVRQLNQIIRRAQS